MDKLAVIVPRQEYMKQWRADNKERMSWENWSEWHIDHKKPLSLFDLTDREQTLQACHYTNLQPLWADENMRKGNR